MEYKLLKLVILVFLSVNLFSKDFLELYRTQGINAVEKELEKSLRDVNSWKKYLENKNVDYGFYETKEYVIVAQKNNKEMSVFAKNGDDFKKISKDNMIIGEKAGDKYLEGDKKTPLNPIKKNFTFSFKALKKFNLKIIYTKYEANPIIKTFTPIELTPPNPKSKACKISAKDIENIATLPKNTPINPKSMR